MFFIQSAPRMSLTNSEPTDRELIAGALGGDARSFERLVLRHQNLVYRFILKQVRNADAAEDLAQDTFVAAFQKLSSFEGGSKFSTWLVGIALNITRNHLNRAPEHRYRFVSDESLEWRPAPGSDPEETAARARRMEALRESIDALPPDLREVLVLVSLEGQSYEDASAAMGIPIGTVKSKLYRAREQVRALLKSKNMDLN